MAAAPAAYPPWVMLDESCTQEVQGSSSIANTNTLASCRTTAGHPISVSLCPLAPPEVSRVCVQLPAGVEVSYAMILAAHGDSVVVQVASIKTRRVSFLPTESTGDHFVYSAGDAAAAPPRPPSLSLIPPLSITYEEDEKGRRPGSGCGYLSSASTGLLRRGEGEFMVAELEMEYVKESDGKVHHEAALHLLRSSSSSCVWHVKRPVISRHAADAAAADDLASSWRSNMVFPVGDQLLCWVDLKRGGGLLFSDVFDESPGLRHVPFPEDYRLGSISSASVTAGSGGAIKLVAVFHRCCCGGVGKSSCRASHHAYAIKTWTLRMDVDDMAWVMDGSLDATQLWALDGYKGLPRVELDIPVVSMDEPNTIYFTVCEGHHEKHGDDTAWRIMVDMKSKTIVSVFLYPKGWPRSRWDRPVISRVSKYFNSKPSGGQPGQDAEAEAVNFSNRRINNTKLQAINSTVQASLPSPAVAILTALQEIPSLDRDELLKAYRILTHDDSGRRFRALMGLPMDLRKDWVLVEIKASEACVLCSACAADIQIKE